MKSHSAVTISKETHDAVIFDLDGVVTKTAKVHAAAWKKLFDGYLEKHASQEGTRFRPFDIETDYRRYVDGKPRYDGVKSFLESRGIDLPYGDPDDPPGRETICGLGNRKNEVFHEHLEREGVEVYGSTVELINQLRSQGLKTAIVSSSKNCAAVLDAASIADLFDTRVDGVDTQQLELEGKPAPDIFLEAARRLNVSPARTAVVEDAIAGVEAGSRGNFGCVIGVDRTGHADDLKEGGADAVVSDLSEVEVKPRNSAPGNGELASALESMEEIASRVRDKEIAVFLDYDGTLTPIVNRPEDAVLSDQMRDTITELANHCFVAVISGRDLRDVQSLVKIDSIVYAGSHGFDTAGPQELHIEAQRGTEFLPTLDTAEKKLRDRLKKVKGALVERKKFSIAIHYRRVNDADISIVERVVDNVQAQHEDLRKSYGKKVYELQPNIDWDKGRALLWLLEALNLEQERVLPLYIGDDVTDEDAFKVLRDQGIGIIVAEHPQQTAARYRLRDPQEVQEFLKVLMRIVGGG